jgi:hypothetical protein
METKSRELFLLNFAVERSTEFILICKNPFKKQEAGKG